MQKKEDQLQGHETDMLRVEFCLFASERSLKWQQFDKLCFFFPTIVLVKIIGLFKDVTDLRRILNCKAVYGVISGETHASYRHGRGILLSFRNHWNLQIKL